MTMPAFVTEGGHPTLLAGLGGQPKRVTCMSQQKNQAGHAWLEEFIIRQAENLYRNACNHGSHPAPIPGER